MPRPRTVHDDAVLDAALAVVGRDGPAGVTFAAVGREAGLSAATVVQRFASKRGLLLALARRGASRAGEDLRAARGRGGSPLAALTDALVASAATIDVPAVLSNHLAFLQLDLADDEFRVLAVEHAERTRAAIRALLDDAVAAGELRAGDTAALVQAVQVTYNGTLITWAIYGTGDLAGWLRRELDVLLEPRRA